LRWVDWRGGAPAETFDEGNQFRGQAGKVGEGLVDHDRLGRKRAGSGTTGRTFGRDALTLDQEDGLVGFAVVLGAIAFDEHAGTSVGEAGAGGKRNNNLLETTHKSTYNPYNY
jgi:hypothetical protein